jgi:hypothetical protein
MDSDQQQQQKEISSQKPNISGWKNERHGRAALVD